MTEKDPRPTFRDPAGSLSFEQNRVVRRIGSAAREPVLDFLASSFCRNAQSRGDLVDAEILDTADDLQLLHPRISPITYPWEWTRAQWLAAAELTLALGQEALAEGWILKDATPLNILFAGTRPVFVDILSFETRDPHASVWLAYGQYVRTFLLPLLANNLLQWPLELTLFRRDGYEPTEVFAALGWPQRLSPAAFWPITLPALLERRKGTEAKPPIARSLPPDVSSAVLNRTLNHLRRRTRQALPRSSKSQWSDYPASLTHYTPAESQDKFTWVQRSLEAAETASGPFHVLDIGANTGEFSALATSLGAEVVALERDLAAADRLYRMTRDRNLPVLTIHADIARPTPAAGWENSESSALLPRLEGQFDTVLMLAVIHHLILMEQIPIPAILTLCHRLTRRHLILEWVPVEDPMYQSLMRGRDTLYGALSEADLLAACDGRFRMLDRHELSNKRVLFFFEKII